MNSNQDKYISLVQDEISLDGTDRAGNLFMPFMERENRFPGIKYEDSYVRSTSSVCVTEKNMDDFHMDIGAQMNTDTKIYHLYNIISLHVQDGIEKAIDQIFKQTDLGCKVIKIECFSNQLTTEEILSIFEQFTNIEQIQIVDIQTG